MASKPSVVPPPAPPAPPAQFAPSRAFLAVFLFLATGLFLSPGFGTALAQGNASVPAAPAVSPAPPASAAPLTASPPTSPPQEEAALPIEPVERQRVTPPSPETSRAVAEAISRARAEGLAAKQAWRRILFITPGWFSDKKSLVDGTRFFLAPGGRTDPTAELEATIEALHHPVADYASPDVHPQCRFPARTALLKEALGLDARVLPAPDCPRFESWFANTRSDGVSLVFSNYYLNNPSSMFGHTFLRLHRRPAPGGVRRSPLLDWSVSYAAFPYTLNPFLYPVLGLAGGFPGLFQMQPYYVKTQEYNDNESRDLWEYELALAPGGVDAMLRSLWELGEEKIDYYYLDDNCAYVLLALIEIAAPEVDVTRAFKFWVTPSDTVRVVARVPGLVKAVHYRPSNRSRFLERWDSLRDGEEDLASRLVRSREAFPWDEAWRALAPEPRARVLDAALEYVDFQEKVALAEEGSSEWKTFRSRLLTERAATRVVSAPLARRPEVERPDAGHSTNRVGVSGGAGFERGDAGARPFAQFEWRPSLQDLMAPGPGYPVGMELDFFDLALRQDFETRRFTLRKLDLLSIVSAQPITGVTRPVSWRMRLGTRQRERCYGRDRSCFLTSIGGGAGATLATDGGGLLAFALPGAELGYSQEKHAGPYAAATASAGILVSPGSNYRIGLLGDYARRYGLGGAGLSDWEARFEHAFVPGRNLEFRARFGYGKMASEKERFEASLALFLYYE